MVLLSSAVILLAFLLGRREVGTKTALAWAFLLAVLPDEVRRGRWSWNPNLIPPLATLTLLLAWRARRAPRSFAGAGLLAFATLLPLIHYSLVGLGALAFFFGLAFTKERRARLLGVALALLLLAPHLVLEARSGFQATRGALALTGHKEHDLERAPLAFPELALHAFDLESYARVAESEPLAFEPALTWLLRALLLAGLVVAIVGLARRRLEPSAVALLGALAAWAPFLVLGLPSRGHYVETAVPLLAFLIAFALTRHRLLGLLLGPIGWGSVLAVWAVLASVDKGLTGVGSEYDLPIREKERACREVLARDLDLVGYPRLEYLVLLEQAWRELPESERARFRRVRWAEAAYWDVILELPHPKKPKGRAVIQAQGSHAVVLEIP
jgi:hypothetical protein